MASHFNQTHQHFDMMLTTTSLTASCQSTQQLQAITFHHHALQHEALLLKCVLGFEPNMLTVTVAKQLVFPFLFNGRL